MKSSSRSASTAPPRRCATSLANDFSPKTPSRWRPTNTWGVVDVLAPFVKRVVVSNPLRTRAIAEAKVKTDKVDALVLAQLLRADFLPDVWRPDGHTRELRHLTTRRATLVSDRTRVKNRLHAVLHQRLIHCPVKDLFSKQGLAWLRALELDAHGRATLASDLTLLDSIEAELAALMPTIAGAAWPDERVRLLMTLPGVDVTVAVALLGAIGDVSRFRDGDAAASYLGLAPSTRQSADNTYHGRITKQGNAHARWLLVQAAQHVANHPGPLGNFFRKLAHRKSRNVAIVAVARKLVVIAWHMLKKNEPYRYALPASTKAKLSRLRVAGTKQRRPGGTPKGTARPVHHGERLGRNVPSLDQVLASESLPARAPLAAGELRQLAAAGLTAFADELRHQSRRKKKQQRDDGA
ncbi:MAG: IS110 family transposase [Myxococcaceae bacterium]|nr:IS110 family transposase [Myxococcaceae bacterium]